MCNWKLNIAFCKNFPDSEIYGIDVAAPCLRYAHARANALGVTAHFSQQNAENTDFDNETFDLVTSCPYSFMRPSHDAIPKIINETYRLLKPGGWMIHLDVYPFHRDAVEPLYDFLKDWEVTNNNENFSGAKEYGSSKIFGYGGFSRESIEFTSAEAVAKYTKGYTGDFYLKLPIYLAQKPHKQ